MSWAKNGTSVHVFPSSSVADSIEIIFLLNIFSVLNLSTAPIVNLVEILSAEIAFTVFFNKKYSGLSDVSNW